MGFHPDNLIRGMIGLVFLLGVCYLFSSNRRAIPWRLVGYGVLAQVALGIGVLTEGRFNYFRKFLEFCSNAFVKLLSLSHAGTDFLFSSLADSSKSWGYIFAIQVLPNIVFFAALSAVLYYLGILQKVVHVFAWMLSKLKITGPESVSTAANIFLGQTEAPLMIRPFLEKMNRSEILCIMIGGMANTAGSVLGAYIGMLGGADVVLQKYFALHLLSQALMSAPAAIVCSKMLFPQAKDYQVDTRVEVPKQKLGDNFLDALSIGITDGLKLAVNVGAMLLAFIALMKVLNYLFFKVGDLAGINDDIVALNPRLYEGADIRPEDKGLTLQFILGYIFSPVAWLIGVDRSDMVQVGQLLGIKTIMNEFVAFQQFSGIKSTMNSKSVLITTYALSGFANFASIGIQIGGISQLAPNQRKNLTELGLKALLGGTIACLMCGCVAGALA